MNVIGRLKKFLFDTSNEDSTHESYHVAQDAKNLNLPPLSDYETRRKEITESTEPIDGIFYLYNGMVIPDYYSECLLSDLENLRRDKMYHSHFYPEYMTRKFEGLYCDEKSLPRGRAEHSIIMIDTCYSQNTEIIKQLKDLYRLRDDFSVITNVDYCCPKCHDTVKTNYISGMKLLTRY